MSATSVEVSWLEQLSAAARRIEEARLEQERAADDKARAISDGVRAHLAEHGGTTRAAIAAVADRLSVSTKTVDQARARAKRAPTRSGLPADLWRQVAELELADLDPLPRRLWQTLGYLIAGIAFDALWLADPGGLLADEVLAAAVGDDPEIGELMAEQLAQTCRTWTRPQSLAVIEALLEGRAGDLPQPEHPGAA